VCRRQPVDERPKADALHDSLRPKAAAFDNLRHREEPAAWDACAQPGKALQRGT